LTHAAAGIAGHQWWHTIDIAPGVSTPGAWDLRPMAGRMPWPESLAGARCLDVGTMDGFWAFEMERRGATEVLGIDLADRARLDIPHDLSGGRPASPNPQAGDTFRLAAQLCGSRASWKDLSVYDLSAAELGAFDLVFIGYTLNLLRDPVAALTAIRRVCRGSVIVLDEISLPLTLLHRAPVATLAPRKGHMEWWVFNAAGLRRAVSLAGFRPVAESGLLKFRAGSGTRLSEVPMAYRMRHAAGLAGISLGIRATPYTT
jgi:tRNA (mo5U34)-methyltransferase